MAYRFTKRPHKYNAKPTSIDGFRFDSQVEARYYSFLKQCTRIQADDPASVLWVDVHPIITYNSTGGRKRIDFTVYYADGRIEFHDVKGGRQHSASFQNLQRQWHHPVGPLVAIRWKERAWQEERQP